MARKNLSVFTNQHDRDLARRSVPDFLTAEEEELTAEMDAQIALLRSPAEVRRWQRRVRSDLDRVLGPFPERTPLRPRVTGKIDLPEMVIEKVVFESRPRYYVTANLYLPKGIPWPAPTVLVPCGHAALGKGHGEHHSTGLGLALQG
jgi:hypothetical protein